MKSITTIRQSERLRSPEKNHCAHTQNSGLNNFQYSSRCELLILVAIRRTLNFPEPRVDDRFPFMIFIGDSNSSSFKLSIASRNSFDYNLQGELFEQRYSVTSKPIGQKILYLKKVIIL